jgi:hypothetical protein
MINFNKLFSSEIAESHWSGMISFRFRSLGGGLRKTPGRPYGIHGEARHVRSVGRCVPTAPRSPEEPALAERRRFEDKAPYPSIRSLNPGRFGSNPDFSEPRRRIEMIPPRIILSPPFPSPTELLEEIKVPHVPQVGRCVPTAPRSPEGRCLAERRRFGDKAPYPSIRSLNPGRFWKPPLWVRGETKTPQTRLRDCGVLKRFTPCWGRKRIRQRDPAPVRPSRRR